MFQVPWPSTGISLPDGNNKRFMASPRNVNTDDNPFAARRGARPVTLHRFVRAQRRD
jgi:hypothetical protein